MSLRAFMIQEAICCLTEAADNLQRDTVHMFEQYEKVEKVIEELRQELRKED